MTKCFRYILTDLNIECRSVIVILDVVEMAIFEALTDYFGPVFDSIVGIH